MGEPMACLRRGLLFTNYAANVFLQYDIFRTRNL